MLTRALYRAIFASMAVLILGAAVCRAENRVTILTDAFGRKPELQLDWGYAALIEYNGKRILFDTGDNAAILQANVKRMHVDLSHLDMVVISHSHGDHTSGLRYVLGLNPDVALFVPDDVVFRGHEVPPQFLATRPEPALAKDHRYFNGNPPAHIPDWKGYSDTKMTVVKETMTVMPGVRLVTLVSDKPEIRRQRFVISLDRRPAFDRRRLFHGYIDQGLCAWSQIEARRAGSRARKPCRYPSISSRVAFRISNGSFVIPPAPHDHGFISEIRGEPYVTSIRICQACSGPRAGAHATCSPSSGRSGFSAT